MSDLTTPAAAALKLEETTIVGCDGMLEFLKQEESTIYLKGTLDPLFDSMGEKFLPESIYVRKEMCDVFTELTRNDRDEKQILIGSPGVGKSILLFLVALYRALTEDKPCCFIRKTRYSHELTSVFVFVKNISAEAGTLTVYYNRSVSKSKTPESILEEMSGQFPIALPSIIVGDVLLFLDGLHEGDTDLLLPHHYLSTSGGYDTPQGEASVSSLVVLGGWQKEALIKGFRSVIPRPGLHLAGTNETEGEDEESQLMDDIFYHTGGRIREALLYWKNPTVWKAKKKDMINKIPRGKAVLSIIDTQGSTKPNSADRLRTMFRNENGVYFGSAVQIVDSQYYVRLLHDKVGLEEYLTAYKHAMIRSLSSAAGCHFEELLHVLFQKRPKPISQVLQSVGTGAEGVQQLQEHFVYWIPSIPNFANIDAVIVIKGLQGSATIWCLQYTVASTHAFNASTFRTQFLKPVCVTLGLAAATTSVKILFVVPSNVISNFQLPEGVERAGFEGLKAGVDCRDVEALQSCFANFAFLEQPPAFPDRIPVAETCGALR